MKNKEIKQHFDQLASAYDRYKQKNCFYYNGLKQALRKIISPQAKILDFGCGSGEILDYLRPRFGLGVDLSPRLIKIARNKYRGQKNLSFSVGHQPPPGKFDYILLIDVLEHLSNPAKTFFELGKTTLPGTQLIVSFVDQRWEGWLKILEKLHLKMPEGPHRRLSKKQVLSLAQDNGFKLKLARTIRLIVTFWVFEKEEIPPPL